MKISVCTIAYRDQPDRPFEQLVAELRDWGFDGLEVWGNHLDGAGLEAVQAALAGTGWPVPMISPYFDFTHDRAAWERSLETAHRFVAYAVALGRPLVRVFTGRVASAAATPSQWRAGVEGIRAACDLGQPHGVRFALETHENQLIDAWPAVLRLLEDVGRDNLLVNYQPGVFALHEELEAVRRLAPYLAHVHYINPVPLGQRNRAGYAAAARPDWGLITEALGAAGFRDFVSIEHPPAPVGVWAAVELAYLRGLLAGG